MVVPCRREDTSPHSCRHSLIKKRRREYPPALSVLFPAYFLVDLKIQRALHLFHGFARNAVGIDHRGPDIGVPQKRLDRADIIVRLQKMGGKGMAERVGRDAFRASLSITSSHAGDFVRSRLHHSLYFLPPRCRGATHDELLFSSPASSGRFRERTFSIWL